MDLKEFEYVLAINEDKSFSKAAKRLFISQPSLSQYINRLENQLGVTLFDRNTIPLTLTYEGELYIEAMQNIVEIFNGMQKSFDDISELKKGRINIGLTPSKANNPLPAILPVFKEHYPDIELILTEATSLELENLLVKGAVDVCMMNLPIKSKGIEYEPIMTENIFLAAPPNFTPKNVEKSSPFPKINIKDLENEQFILLHSDQRLRQIADNIFDSIGMKPKILLQTSSIETAIDYLLLTWDLVLFQSLLLDFLQWLILPKYYTFGNTETSWTLVIAYRQNAYRSKAVTAFAEIAKKVVSR